MIASQSYPRFEYMAIPISRTILLLFLLALPTLPTSVYLTSAMQSSTAASSTSNKKLLTFPFVHPSIAEVLACDSGKGDATTSTMKPGPLLDTTTPWLRIQEWPIIPEASTATILPQNNRHQQTALIQLALECDAYIILNAPKDFQIDDASEEGDSYAIYKIMISWGMQDCWNQPPRVSSNENTTTSKDDAQLLFACLLGLNRLEAAIRTATGNTTPGRAPLLKTMMEQLSLKQQQDANAAFNNSHTVQVLQALLSPLGLNLRNLVWHGFVASLPRPWLALILVLIVMLEREYPVATAPSLLLDDTAAATTDVDTNNNNNATSTTKLPNLRQSNPAFGPLLERGDELLAQQGKHIATIDTSWVVDGKTNADTISHPSHQDWWNLATQWMETRQYPLCTCILVTCLIEHALRQLWCKVNDQDIDRMAKPGSYYVTLDGHGQRYQHDVLLHPYIRGVEKEDESENSVLSVPSKRNVLIKHLGGPTMALLADLYCSPCGGPNLRAGLAHGLWDAHLEEELTATSGNSADLSITVSEEQEAWDMAKILLALMEEIGKTTGTTANSTPHSKSGSPLRDYHPQFSYTAVTCRNLDRAMKELHMLEVPFATNTGKEKRRLAQLASNLSLESLEPLKWSWDKLGEQASTIRSICNYSSTTTTPWGSEDVFQEHQTNRVLASVGAARTLLLEVANASESFRHRLEEALGDSAAPSDGASCSSRKRKQRPRLIAASELAVTVYMFAAAAALLLLECDLDNADDTCQSAGGAGAGVDSKGNAMPLNNASSLERAVLLQAVKRSRMMVSTVSNFICANTDRAIKAANEYSKGKAIRSIINDSSID